MRDVLYENLSDSVSECLCVALIPAYEPDEKLLSLLRELTAAGLKNIVVDDGSGEAYNQLFAEAAEYATVLSYPENHGKGHALKYGLSYINEHIRGKFIVVTLDSDGQHQVRDALRICKEAVLRPDALILGSRPQNASSPLKSRFGNYITRKTFAISTGQHIMDTQTGLRAFSSALLPQMLSVPGERYEYEMDVLLQAARAGLPIIEVEIATIYIDNNSGSHFSALRDSWRIYKEIFKFSGISLMSFCLDYVLYSLIAWVGLAAGLPFACGAANISARFISCTFNFGMNRHFVFHDHGNIWRSALQYYALAAVILLFNTLLLSLFIDYLAMNHYLGKLLTEITFFAMSWFVQKRFIFTNKKVADKNLNCAPIKRPTLFKSF